VEIKPGTTTNMSCCTGHWTRKKLHCDGANFHERTHYSQLNLEHQRPSKESSRADPRLPKYCTNWMRRIFQFCARQSNNHGAFAMLNCRYEINFHLCPISQIKPLVFQLFRHERLFSFSMTNGVMPMLWHFLMFVSQSTYLNWLKLFKIRKRKTY